MSGWRDWAEFYDKSLSALNRQARSGSRRVLVEFTSKERGRLRELCLEARAKVKGCDRLRASPLKIIGFGDDFENGYPHTHSDTIFLPCPKFFRMSAREQLGILIHEWIHVYQRRYPIPFHKYLFEVNGLKMVRLTSAHPDFPSVRRNPDVNDVTYSVEDGKFTLPLLQEEARSLVDVRTGHYGSDGVLARVSPATPSAEHPFETVAYNLTEALLSENLDPKMAKRYF